MVYALGLARDKFRAPLRERQRRSKLRQRQSGGKPPHSKLSRAPSASLGTSSVRRYTDCGAGASSGKGKAAASRRTPNWAGQALRRRGLLRRPAACANKRTDAGLKAGATQSQKIQLKTED